MKRYQIRKIKLCGIMESLITYPYAIQKHVRICTRELPIMVLKTINLQPEL